MNFVIDAMELSSSLLNGLLFNVYRILRDYYYYYYYKASRVKNLIVLRRISTVINVET